MFFRNISLNWKCKFLVIWTSDSYIHIKSVTKNVLKHVLQDMWATKNGANITDFFHHPSKLRHSERQKPSLVSNGFHNAIRSICSKYLTFLRLESLVWNVRVQSLLSLLIPKFNDVTLTLSVEWGHSSRIYYRVEFRVKNDIQSCWHLVPCE